MYRRQGSAVIEVDDDGRGFDVTSAEGLGNGLRNLRDRTVALKGEVEILSTPSEGTTVRFVVPI